MDGYSLSRQWFDFAFENPEKMSPDHTAIYLLAVELWNRLGQKDRFGFPSYNNMEVLGIKNHRTYRKYFNDLIEWGFIKIIQESKNQYTANVIALVKNTQPNTKALDKANAKHCIGTASIDKQLNNKTIKLSFEDFWNIYPRKIGKPKALLSFQKIKDKSNIIGGTQKWISYWKKENTDIQYIPHPTTFLNREGFNDDCLGGGSTTNLQQKQKEAMEALKELTK